MILCQPTFVLKFKNNQANETGWGKKVGLEFLLGMLKARKRRFSKKKYE